MHVQHTRDPIAEIREHVEEPDGGKSRRAAVSIHVYRVLFVALWAVIAILDVDSAFNGYGDALTVTVAVVLLTVLFAVWMRLVVRAVWQR